MINLKLRIGPRLALGFGVLAALLLTIGAVGLYGLYNGNETTKDIIEKEWVKASLVNEMHALAAANQEATFKLAIIKDEAERSKIKTSVTERVKRIDAIFADLEPRLYKAEGKALMGEMKTARKTYVDSFKVAIGMSDAGRYDEAREYSVNTVAPNFDTFEGFMNQLAKFQNKLVDDAGAHSVANYQTNRNISIAIGALAVLLGAALAWFTTRHITDATGKLAGAVARVAAGDSTARSNVKSGDELEQLSAAFDSMVAERVAALAQKEKESELLNDSIIDILRSVAKTAQGDLTVHAPVREDITGALSDAINSMSDSTAKTLAKVTVAATEVRTASQDGRETVHQTSRGMNDIRGTIQETAKRIKRLGERSQEITGIVKLIDDIAERTSVLALNANMQAAMAGEAGRGFRVVADEVQRLAERSKEATDQIGKLVGTIQAETNDTMATMDRAIGEVVKGGELADKAAEKVTHLDQLGGQLLESVGAFRLPEEVLKEAGVGESAARDNRRAA